MRIPVQESRGTHAAPPCCAEQFALEASVADCLDLTQHRLVLCCFARNHMANRFGADILIQTQDPKQAVLFYVKHLGFEITDDNPKMIALHGKHINLFIEPGPPLGPVLEVTVENVGEAKRRLLEQGCEVVKDEPNFPRCYIKDPFGLIYNLTS